MKSCSSKIWESLPKKKNNFFCDKRDGKNKRKKVFFLVNFFLNLPEWHVCEKESWKHLRQSWENKESDVIGRFNLIWNGTDNPKLLDYNGETPTLLIESSIAQWRWQLEVNKKIVCFVMNCVLINGNSQRI